MNNITECIVRANHLGFTRAHNTCTGAVSDIPWGTVDWVTAGGMAALVAFALFVLISLSIQIWRNPL